MDKNKKSNFLKNIKKTWKYVKDSRIYLVGYALVSILEGIIGAIAPLISAQIVLNITDGAMNQLIITALIALGIDIGIYIVFYVKNSCYQKIFRKTLINLQIEIAKETLKLEVREMDKSSSGMFIDRLNRDTADISSMFMEYTYWLSYIISNVGVLVAIYILNRYMFAYAIATSIIVFLINRKRLAKETEVQREVKKLQEKKTGLTSEIVRGIRDIKVLNASKSALHQTKDRIVESVNEELKLLRIRRIYMYIEGNVKAITDFILLILGCFLYNKGLLTIPAFVIVFNYQARIKNLLTGIVKLFEYNKKFIVSSDRLYEIIEDDTFAKEKFGTTKVKKLNGHIEFKDVSFGYAEDKKILDRMNFTIEPNKKVAFVGKSGVGKTTIFNLITRLYHTDSGNILLDGHDIEDLTESSIRDNMSIITQDPYIFNFSIKDNLLLAKENASMKEIRNACKMACIDDYIMSLPDKYDTLVGENGVILSGGQKQRLAIARALLMKTEIILFDEATSALDNETQEEIQNAIANMKGEYTILIVAHRLSTVVDSDEIFVVEDGKIIDSGTHKQLLKRCKFYKELYDKDLHV